MKKTKTKILIKVLKILASDIYDPQGVTKTALHECADRMQELYDKTKTQEQTK